MKFDRRYYAAMEVARANGALSPGEIRLLRFASAVRDGEPPSARLLDELAECFEQILFAKADPAAALGLKRKRGARPARDPATHWRRVEIAAAVLAEKRRRPALSIKTIAGALVPVYLEKATFIEDCFEALQPEAALALTALGPVSAATDAALRELRRLSGYSAVRVVKPKRPRLIR